MRSNTELNKWHSFEVDGEKFRTKKMAFQKAERLKTKYFPIIIQMQKIVTEAQKKCEEYNKAKEESEGAEIETPTITKDDEKFLEETGSKLVDMVCDEYFEETEYKVKDKKDPSYDTWIPLNPAMFESAMECYSCFMEIFTLNHSSAFQEGPDTSETSTESSPENPQLTLQRPQVLSL